MYIQCVSESQFWKSNFSIGACAKKYDGLHKITFWASVPQFLFQRAHMQIFGESQFCNAHFLLGFAGKYDGLQKLTFWASVGILDFSERIYKFSVNLSLGGSNFLVGRVLKIRWLT